MIRIRCSLWAVVFVRFLSAQLVVSGPAPSFFFDAGSRSIRSIVGMPGAAYAGSAVAADLDDAMIAPNGSVAIGWKQQEVVFLRLSLQQSTALTVADLIPGADRAAWSGDSKVLFLGSSSLKTVQKLTFGAGSIMASERIDLSSFGWQLSLIRVDRTAQSIIVGMIENDGTALYRVDENGQAVLLARAADFSASVFSRDGRALYVFNRSSSQVLSIDTGSNAGTPGALPGTGEDAVDIVELSISKDGKSLYGLSAGNQSIYTWDLATQTLSSVLRLEFSPFRLTPVGDGSVLLVSNRSSSLLALFDTSSRPEIFFVPKGGQE